MALNPEEIERYKRHLSLRGFGPAAQEKLKTSSVLVIGAGGLGCPALLYLAAAGVGRIEIVDPDTVDISNLQRQVLYVSADAGANKAQTAARRLGALNPLVRVEAHPVRFDRSNALDLVRSCDLVVDGSDNFPTRYLVNDACVLAGRPFVYGAIQGFERQDQDHQAVAGQGEAVQPEGRRREAVRRAPPPLLQDADEQCGGAETWLAVSSAATRPASNCISRADGPHVLCTERARRARCAACAPTALRSACPPEPGATAARRHRCAAGCSRGCRAGSAVVRRCRESRRSRRPAIRSRSERSARPECVRAVSGSPNRSASPSRRSGRGRGQARPADSDRGTPDRVVVSVEGDSVGGAVDPQVLMGHVHFAESPTEPIL